MTAQQIESTLDHATHGLFVPLFLYGIIAVCSLAGLKRGGAGLRQYLAWPITSLATAVVTFIVLGKLCAGRPASRI